MAWFSSLRRKRRRWAGLTRGERGLLRRALALLPLVALARRLLPVRRVSTLLEWMLPPRHVGERDAPPPHRAAWLVDAASRHGPVRATCLERSLVLAALLRRQGIASRVQIGVRKSGSGFEAHAWVEWQGEVLNDAADVGAHYVIFAVDAPPK
jgi:hypothetical protein